MAPKKSANNEVFENVKNTFEMEIDNEILKQSNCTHVKGNATKLEYTNYNKNINGFSFLLYPTHWFLFYTLLTKLLIFISRGTGRKILTPEYFSFKQCLSKQKLFLKEIEK